MISQEFRTKVREAIIQQRENYSGSDAQYAKTLGIAPAIYSRLVNKGEIDRVLGDANWLTIGRLLNVSIRENPWKIAITPVYRELEEAFHECQQLSQSRMLVDDTGIGKTVCAKHIVKGMKNGFYFDCSQAKNKQAFIRQLAKTVGVDHHGRYYDVKANLKYFLNILESPFIALDEFGDLEYQTYLEVKELWNGTEGHCAWFAIGADGLQQKIDAGIAAKKVGYRELFRRFSEDYAKLVPLGVDDRATWYRELYKSVATINCDNPDKVRKFVKLCSTQGKSLTFLETLIKSN